MDYLCSLTSLRRRMPRPDLIYDVLSMLAMDDESPWILHNVFIAWPEYHDLDVSEVLAALEEIDKRGWATPWVEVEDDPKNPNRHGLPTPAHWQEARAYYDDFVQRNLGPRTVPQEYGPWYRLTDSGRTEFERMDAERED